ncbi:hypothetical protein [uncultured Clostridium sp.]|uniref:hypothetical protein n=1 Tax=uncultured Clostridium sp. TaxID=59620 RepID=UPI00260A1125|nr:hypothetical protein [uncultured Clostridium sp.]
MGNSFVDKFNAVGNWEEKAGQEQKFQSGYGMQALGVDTAKDYLAVGAKLNEEINNNDTVNVANMLKSQNTIWQNYIKAENSAINNNGGSIVPVEEANNYGAIEGNEVAFNIYNYLFDNGVNPQFSSQIYQEEVPWVTFKEQMINTVNEAYPNDPENALAKAKMNIRLTEGQVINLLGYISTT